MASRLCLPLWLLSGCAFWLLGSCVAYILLGFEVAGAGRFGSQTQTPGQQALYMCQAALHFRRQCVDFEDG
jgi:hypothetical protein